MAFAMPENQSQTAITSVPPQLDQARRTRRQLGLFFAGAGFLTLSTMITRRALVRKYNAMVPKFYQQSNRPNAPTSGAVEALEALNLATVNVFSFGMMFTGGMMWAFNVASIEDMQRYVRGPLGLNGKGSLEDKEAEAEVEQWLASVFSKKDQDIIQAAKAKDEARQAEESAKP
jgi:hypothetical protein